MEKPWLSEYPPGVPADIDPNEYNSVLEVVDASVRRYGERPAFASFSTRLSFKELDALAARFAAFLQQGLNVGKRDRVAIMAPNILAYPVALFGIMRTGAITVNINPQYTARELESQLVDAGVQTIVIAAGATPVLAEVIGRTAVRHVIVVQTGDLLHESMLPQSPPDPRLPGCVDFQTALDRGASLSLQPVAVGGDDLLFLQYTGGTTGIAKGAALTHRNLVANLAQYASWLAGKQVIGKEVIVTALPLYHIFALMANCLSAVRMGALSVLIADPRDLPGLVAAFRYWRFTMITGVNTLFNHLLNTDGFAGLEFALRISIGGGAAVQRAVAERWFAVTGSPILEGYGLSETSPVLTMNRIDETAYTGSIGLPWPSTEISLRDERGDEVPPGEPGELCARGPQVMQGYWNRPDATRLATTADGFFRTGDIATVDEHGYFRIVDRKKDMILVSGFNVYPNEIEGVIATRREVVECACVGVPDEQTGEAVKVYVVKRPGADIRAAELVALCRKQLAAYKVPKQVEFLDELPKTNVGKILRRALKARDP